VRAVAEGAAARGAVSIQLAGAEALLEVRALAAPAAAPCQTLKVILAHVLHLFLPVVANGARDAPALRAAIGRQAAVVIPLTGRPYLLLDFLIVNGHWSC
jgi:hypothetical protein